MRGRKPLVACPLRPGIICDRQASCDGCGWNPAEEKRRIHQIRENRKVRPAYVRRSYVSGKHRHFFNKGGVR